jgi:CBS-domain-containing membrane protein
MTYTLLSMLFAVAMSAVFSVSIANSYRKPLCPVAGGCVVLLGAAVVRWKVRENQEESRADASDLGQDWSGKLVNGHQINSC